MLISAVPVAGGFTWYLVTGAASGEEGRQSGMEMLMGWPLPRGRTPLTTRSIHCQAVERGGAEGAEEGGEGEREVEKRWALGGQRGWRAKAR